jgi:hypothetical protein
MDVSIFKEKKLEDAQKMRNNSKITIRGISPGELSTYGITQLNLKFHENCEIMHDFHIVNRNVPLDYDGIIGRDFLIKYRASVDYDSFLLRFNFNSAGLEMPLLDSIQIIPPQSEIICKVNIKIDDESIFFSEEIDDGVFCANTIVGKTPLVRIINTNFKAKTIKNFTPKIAKLSDFHILQNNELTIAQQFRIERLKEELCLDKEIIPENVEK